MNMQPIKISLAIFVITILAADLAGAWGGNVLPVVQFYRYYNEQTGDHFYETINEDLGNIGYTQENIACGYVFPTSVSRALRKELGLVPLYRYWNEGFGDHFYEIKYEDLSSIGYAYEGEACYVFPPGINTTEVEDSLTNRGYIDVPKIIGFYRYWNEGLQDHFYETKDEDLSFIGYASEGLECFVFSRSPFPEG